MMSFKKIERLKKKAHELTIATIRECVQEKLSSLNPKKSGFSFLYMNKIKKKTELSNVSYAELVEAIEGINNSNFAVTVRGYDDWSDDYYIVIVNTNPKMTEGMYFGN